MRLFLAVFRPIFGAKVMFLNCMLFWQFVDACDRVKKKKSYLASSAVDAGVVRALVADPVLAVGAGVAGWAAAGVGALTRVSAGGAVLAGPVVGAVVEVLVAEEAAPALVADALLGLLAGAVLAAGVGDALVAEATGPSGLASERRHV